MKYWAVKKYSKIPKEERPAPDFPEEYPYATVNLGTKNYYINPDFEVMNDVQYKEYKSNVENLFWEYQQNLEVNKRDFMKVQDYMIRVKEFTSNLIENFAAENVFLGISQLGLTNHVRTSLSQVSGALMVYSLKDAIEELIKLDDSILDDRILTPARLLSFRNKIEDFLGVPRGTEWNGPKTW